MHSGAGYAQKSFAGSSSRSRRNSSKVLKTASLGLFRDGEAGNLLRRNSADSYFPSSNNDQTTKRLITTNMMDTPEIKEQILLEVTDEGTEPEFIFEYKTFFIILLCLNASLGNFYIGYSMGSFDTIQINLQTIYAWNDSQKNLFTSIMTASLMFGAIFGSLLSSPILSKIGRRKTYILANCISFVAIGLTMILNEYVMICGRLISGVVCGIYSPLVALYVSEYAPYRISGLCGAIYEFMYCFSIFVSYLMGLNLPEVEEVGDQWWRFMVGFPAIFNILNTILLLYVFKYDTPKYLFMIKKDETATRKSLNSIYKRDEDSEEVIKDLKMLLSQQEEEMTFSSLFNKKYRKRMLIGIALFIGQQACGIDALIMYSDEIFLNDVDDRKTATMFTIFIGLSQMLSSVCAIFIIEHLGRRKLFLGGTGLVIVFLSALSVCYYMNLFSPIVYLFVAFTFVNGTSLSPLPFVIGSDIIPEKGFPLGVALNYVTSFSVTQTFLFLKTAIGLSGTMSIYTVLTICTFIIGAIFLKETKGLSYDEIDLLYTDQQETKFKLIAEEN
jgi:SP family arabinose:H+ symporter-like MFS transporter